MAKKSTKSKAAIKKAAIKKAVTKKAVTKKASTSKVAIKKAATAKTSTAKTSTAKTSTPRTSTAKTSTARTTTKKAAPKRAAPRKPTTAKAVSAKSAAKGVRIASIEPVGDGTVWSLTLADGKRTKVAAAAAQSIGIRVGGMWSDATIARAAQATDDLKSFSKAMKLLARSGPMTYDALVAKLGNDTRAKRTVAALVSTGWVA